MAGFLAQLPGIAGVEITSLAQWGLSFVVYTGGVMVLTVLFTYAMHMPTRVARARRAGVHEAVDPAEDEAAVKSARADVRAAAIRSAALLGVVFAAARVAEQSLGHFPSTTNLFVLTAIGLNIVAEWRARRAHGELVVVLSGHDIDATDAAARALAGAGIALLARGAHHRSMLQALGPYVPVEPMVPPDHAEEARRIVERFAPAKDAERPAAAEVPRTSRRARVHR